MEEGDQATPVASNATPRFPSRWAIMLRLGLGRRNPGATRAKVAIPFCFCRLSACRPCFHLSHDGTPLPCWVSPWLAVDCLVLLQLCRVLLLPPSLASVCPQPATHQLQNATSTCQPRGLQSLTLAAGDGQGGRWTQVADVSCSFPRLVRHLVALVLLVPSACYVILVHASRASVPYGLVLSIKTVPHPPLLPTEKRDLVFPFRYITSPQGRSEHVSALLLLVLGCLACCSGPWFPYCSSCEAWPSRFHLANRWCLDF